MQGERDQTVSGTSSVEALRKKKVKGDKGLELTYAGEGRMRLAPEGGDSDEDSEVKSDIYDDDLGALPAKHGSDSESGSSSSSSDEELEEASDDEGPSPEEGSLEKGPPAKRR